MSGAVIPIVKAHALGNDFLLVRAAAVQDIGDLGELARRACDRHRGPGADGLMVLTDTAQGADTRLYNADGGEAEVSGNGVRCAAGWLARERRLQPGASLVLGTVAGPKRLELKAVDRHRLTFRADMGAPTNLREEEIDLGSDRGQTRVRHMSDPGLTPGRVRAVVMNVGNPQCVVLGPATQERLQTLASSLAVHPFFPAGTNVELAEIEGPGQVRILIWERGVGPTEASGTGACAAAVAAAFAGGASRAIDVTSPGGTQHVEWTTDTIWLTGWTEVVADMNWWS